MTQEYGRMLSAADLLKQREMILWQRQRQVYQLKRLNKLFGWPRCSRPSDAVFEGLMAALPVLRA